MKLKVLFRVMVSRRDAIYCLLMKELLERKGCEVILTSGRGFVPAAKLWKPDIIITSTPAQALVCKEIAPHSLSVFLDAEGFQALDGTRANQYSENPALFNATDLVLVWGKAEEEAFKTVCSELDDSKVHVFGNPKLDFVRYLPKSIFPKEKPNSVGFVSRFPRINHHEGIPTIRNLWERHTCNFTITMTRAYTSFYEVARAVLENTDLDVSVRVHPFEDIGAYYKYFIPALPKEHQHRVSIDDSLGFTDWAIKQKALVSPTSTSFLEGYLLNIPIYNLDFISNTFEHNNAYAEVCAAWQGGANQPQTLEQLCEALINEQPDVQKDKSIEEQLIKYCDWGDPHSACLRAVNHILNAYHEVSRKRKRGWPKALVKLRDDISFKKTMKRQPLHSNFNFKEGYHHRPDYIDEMADTILSDQVDEGLGQGL